MRLSSIQNSQAVSQKVEKTRLVDQAMLTSRVFGLKLWGLGRVAARAWLVNKLTQPAGQSGAVIKVFTPNSEQIVQADADPNFLRLLKTADLLLPDGIGLVWAARFLGQRVKERVTGREVMLDLLEIAEQKKFKVLVLGGRRETQVADKIGVEPVGRLGKRLKENQVSQIKELPGLGLKPEQLFWLPAYQQVTKPESGEERVVAQVIKQIKPTIVLVAFGAPKQERWVIEHETLLTRNQVGVVLVVGGAWDLALGRLKVVPALASQLGLEWLFRLAQEPWRWRRQLRLTKFMQLTVAEFIKNFRKI